MSDLTIGVLAKETNVRTDTIRYYEQLGLVKPQGRSKAGYRVYGQNSIRLVQFIRRAKDLGFKLAEIKTLLTLSASQTATCKDILESTAHKLKEAKENIRQLKNIHDALEKLADECPGGDEPLSECPILDHLYPKTEGF